jgi:hypothetical protein
MYLFIPEVTYELILQKLTSYFRVKYIGEDTEKKSYIFNIIEFVVNDNLSIEYPNDEYLFPKEFISRKFIVLPTHKQSHHNYFAF